MLLCILMIPLNPNGVAMWWYPYQTLQDGQMLKLIEEWRPSNPNLMSDLGYFFFLGYLLFLLLRAKNKIQFLDLMLLLAFGFLALKSIRFWPLFFIVATFTIAKGKENPKEMFRFEPIVGIMGILLILGVSLQGSRILSSFDSARIDPDIISYLKQNPPQRLFNDYNEGGYLIYQGVPVFIDGRADLYSQHNLTDYYNLLHLNGDFKTLLEYYNFDVLLLEKGSSLAIYLKEKENYEILLQKGEHVLYQKKDYIV